MPAPNQLPDTDGNKQHRPQPSDLANLNVTRPDPPHQPQDSDNKDEKQGLENQNVTGPAPTDRA